ncbi:MAG: hypothetical protein HFF08_07145 [Oscillospiraceae bacterium]|nr:hypothetical protein [Oscillospiraceae bacterium]
MANEKNLIPMDQRTESEQREIQSKGGKASGAARRRKKTMRQAAAMLLGADISGGERDFVEKIRPRLLAFGISEGDATYQDVLLASIMLKAMKGDVKAAAYIRDTAGENPSLELKKQELKLRQEELRLKREQLRSRAISERAASEDGDTAETIHIYIPDNGRMREDGV